MNLPQGFTLYLMVAPGEAAEAAQYALPLAHMAYRVGGGPHLFRTQLQVPLRGGVLALDHRGFDGRGAPEPLCREIAQECTARGFRGIFCDFEGSPLPILQKAVQTLAATAQKRGWSLYLPENYASECPGGAKVVIPTALSGGSLRQRLSEAVSAYGADRVVLGLDRVAEDFTLPAASGSGRPLSQEELARLIRERGPWVYFSDELCAHYFTYMRPGENAHFILYDDAASLFKKLRVANALGIREAFLPYGTCKSLLPELLA